MDDIERVAREANAHNFVTELPEGYNTRVFPIIQPRLQASGFLMQLHSTGWREGQPAKWGTEAKNCYSACIIAESEGMQRDCSYLTCCEALSKMCC